MIVQSARQLAALVGKSRTMLNRDFARGKFKQEPGGGFDVDKVKSALARSTDAKAFSRERIAPMIRDTPELRAIFSASKSRAADNTIEEKFFTGGMLAITSAGSPANLSRRAIRFLFCDEVDKYQPSAGPEGNPISLARKRLGADAAGRAGRRDQGRGQGDSPGRAALSGGRHHR
jgi:hypothetical protein